MMDTVPPQTVTASNSRGLGGRLVGVVFSPRATYTSVAARPRVLGALAAVALISAVSLFVFLSSDVGTTAALDQQVRQMESFGRTLTDAQYQRMEQMAPYSRYVGALFQLVTLPIMALIVAGIALAVFNAGLGEDASFKQVLAIVAHSGAIIVLSQLFNLPLAYARESLSSAANLAVFLPFLDESSFAARLLGSIDLFIVWWVVSLSIGLAVLYRRRTGPVATTMLIVYGGIGLVIAAVKSMASGA